MKRIRDNAGPPGAGTKDFMTKRSAGARKKSAVRSSASPRAPAQTRSRESMEVLLEVGRRMIEERGIDDVRISDVASAAGSSIGALYFRFGNRERFIDEVMQRQIEVNRGDFDELARRLRTSAKTPDAVIGAVIDWLVSSYERNQGVLRSQMRRALETPQVWRPLQDLARYIVEEIGDLLRSLPESRAGSEWRTTLPVAMQLVYGTLNNILINRPGPLDLGDPATVTELTKAVLRYLQVEDSGAPRTKR